jgi:hypothetical protein
MPWYWTVGNVWQYTSSEFIDEHGRAVLLRGGSHYLPAASFVSCRDSSGHTLASPSVVRETSCGPHSIMMLSKVPICVRMTRSYR